MLELIPEWLSLLDGSGLEPLQDFHRIFVASPSLKRSALVVSGRVRGGQPAIARAVNALAKDRRKPAAFAPQGELRVAPWHNRGPTQRVIGTVGQDQIVIARPTDVSRALAVSAALGARHGKEKKMERLSGPLALLAMYQGEAVALSIEGVAQYMRGDKTHAPLGVRLRCARSTSSTPTSAATPITKARRKPKPRCRSTKACAPAGSLTRKPSTTASKPRSATPSSNATAAPSRSKPTSRSTRSAT